MGTRMVLFYMTTQAPVQTRVRLNHLDLSNNDGLCEISSFEPYFPRLASDGRRERRKHHETIRFT